MRHGTGVTPATPPSALRQMKRLLVALFAEVLILKRLKTVFINPAMICCLSQQCTRPAFVFVRDVILRFRIRLEYLAEVLYARHAVI